MSSISTEASGNRVIQFKASDGKRRSLRLGKMALRDVVAIQRYVDKLVTAKISNLAIDGEVANWLAGVSDWLRRRLAGVGLIDLAGGGKTNVPTLGEYLERYRELRSDVKPWTQTNYRQAIKNAVEFFGADRRLDAITPGDADEFRLWLLERLGENTARRHLGRCKQFLAFAVRKDFIAKNPFADLRGLNVRANRARDYFVSRAVAEKVLQACPDNEWRLIFALCRYAGIRCPSEVLALTWGDVNWETGRMTIRSPKTEHHEGKESRVIPIFPEVRPFLEAAWDEAAEGAVQVVTMSRDPGVNWRTQFTRILERAGLTPWPKLFHNLRASRETELASEFPLHVVCEWIGNSQPVAARHYLRVTDADFAKAVQKAVQQDAESSRTDSQGECSGELEVPELRDVAAMCELVQSCTLPPVGLEPTTR